MEWVQMTPLLIKKWIASQKFNLNKIKSENDKSLENLKDNNSNDILSKSQGVFGIATGFEKSGLSMNQHFDFDLEKMNTNGLKLPEEDKHEGDMADGIFKINFANDPVMKSLLEAKQDQWALQQSRVSLIFLIIFKILPTISLYIILMI